MRKLEPLEKLINANNRNCNNKDFYVVQSITEYASGNITKKELSSRLKARQKAILKTNKKIEKLLTILQDCPNRNPKFFLEVENDRELMGQ